jgi:hypothetical protein
VQQKCCERKRWCSWCEDRVSWGGAETRCSEAKAWREGKEQFGAGEGLSRLSNYQEAVFSAVTNSSSLTISPKKFYSFKSCFYLSAGAQIYCQLAALRLSVISLSSSFSTLSFANSSSTFSPSCA